jgi:glycine cleavage system H protein
MYPQELKYSAEHTWLKLENDNKGRVGITHYAQEQLKEVVFVELPEIGTEVFQMQPFGVIESRKSTIDVYSPVSGIVAEVNHLLEAEPSLVNHDSYGQGWMFVVELIASAELDSLMSAKDYQAFITQ